MDEKDTTNEKELKDNPKAKWEKRGFAINQGMKQVCEMGIIATKAEIDVLKRKLRKLQYGS